MDQTTKNGMRPIDFLDYGSQHRDLFTDAAEGKLPDIEPEIEVPIIPDYAIACGEAKKKKKGGKKSKKGGKGKKGGKKGKKKKK